jgi:hypothetical protein
MPGFKAASSCKELLQGRAARAGQGRARLASLPCWEGQDMAGSLPGTVAILKGTKAFSSLNSMRRDSLPQLMDIGTQLTTSLTKLTNSKDNDSESPSPDPTRPWQYVETHCPPNRSDRRFSLAPHPRPKPWTHPTEPIISASQIEVPLLETVIFTLSFQNSINLFYSAKEDVSRPARVPEAQASRAKNWTLKLVLYVRFVNRLT